MEKRMDNNTYWKCKECDDNCLLTLLEGQDDYEVAPNSCVLSDKHMSAAWYQLFDKPKEHMLEEDPIDAPLIEPEVTPNCAICAWLRLEYAEDKQHLTYDICTAMGGHDCDDVYSSPYCLNLYQDKNKMHWFDDVAIAAKTSKLVAIKKYKKATGLGLKESKEAVEKLFKFDKK